MAPTNSPPRGKKGFRIGKKASPSAYLGKAARIKQTLIHKAKLKKQRARELARAGYHPAVEQQQPAHHPSRTTHHPQRTSSPAAPRPDDSPHPSIPAPQPPQPPPSHTPPAPKALPNNPSRPNRPPAASSQHANGQPKMSHRLDKILRKLQHEKLPQSQ